MERTNLEVCAVNYLHISQLHSLWQEQRKAALRKVELELDEADDIVNTPSVNADKSQPHSSF